MDSSETSPEETKKEAISIWKEVLKSFGTDKRSIVKRNVIVLGHETSGKDKLLRYLQGEAVMREIGEIRGTTKHSFGMNYSYLRYKDGMFYCGLILAEHMNVYEIEDSKFTDFLDIVIKTPEDLKNTIVLICLDVMKIRRLIEDLDHWLNNIKRNFERIAEKMDQESIVDIKRAHAEKFKNPKKEAEAISINLGIPIIVTLCKSDLVWKVAEENHQPKYAFDFLNPGEISHYFLNFMQFCLRRKLLDYGACLVYASTKEGFINCKLLLDLVRHLFFGEEFKYPPEKKQHDSIFIPFAYDTKLQIADLQVEHLVKKPDETRFVDIVKEDKKEKTAENTSKIQDFQKFLKMQRQLIKFETRGGKQRPGGFNPRPVSPILPEKIEEEKKEDVPKKKRISLIGKIGPGGKRVGGRKGSRIKKRGGRKKAPKKAAEKEEMEDFFTAMLNKLNKKKEKGGKRTKFK